MALFISVVNHSHDDIICANPTLKKLAKEHSIVLKSNTIATYKLKQYCQSSGITLIQGDNKKGFGANNNEVFNYLINKKEMKNKDYFLILNPDIEVNNSTINSLISKVAIERKPISTINLFTDREMTKFDNSIRHFPSLLNPIKSILNIKRDDQYDKSQIFSPVNIDWAAGSFLLFKCEVFKKLQGFDEKYFMYFEDVDICKRAKNEGDLVTYYPELKGVHLAQHSNRKLLSKEFLYYLKSTLIYFIR
ncbi:glycosyltransferase family 2 protein [Vibrio echinoideorum]|uniref:glycosyltransferase family 2 protein n=1 Tax=Vibrio echinoideorum TaxID=2100116 RepID=UPI00108139D5|nr:glycosyltransferase family 2 protein [Vibrio echinoideorum]